LTTLQVVLEQNPPKQGLKLLARLGCFRCDNVLEQNPPKQGLKQLAPEASIATKERFRAKSTKTRIETRFFGDIKNIFQRFRAKSTKTRIETPRYEKTYTTKLCFRAKSTKTRIETIFKCFTLVWSIDVLEQNPPKQGLKPVLSTFPAGRFSSFRAKSTKTRIET